MQVTVTTFDGISPGLRKAIKALDNPKPVLEAMGLSVVSWARRAFDDPSYRPSPWAQRKDNLPHPLLKLHGATGLWGSIGLTNITKTSVSGGSDRPYAAIHQLGGVTPAHIIKPKNKKALFWPGAAHPVKQVKHPGSKVPPRPYFPFYANGDMIPAAAQQVESVGRNKVLSMLN